MNAPTKRPPWSCGCGRRWTSLTQAHCTVCHEHFATVGVSDAHQTDGRCTYPAEVTRKNGTPVYRLSREAEGDVWRSFQRRAFGDPDSVSLGEPSPVPPAVDDPPPGGPILTSGGEQ